MSDPRRDITDAELHMYLDGEIEESRANAVAAGIASDPELSARAAGHRAVGEMLHRAYDPVLEAPIPGALLRAAARRARPRAFAIAAAVAWLGIGVVVGVAANRMLAPPQRAFGERPLPREAEYAHRVYVPEVRHPVEVGANERTHLDAWLSKRLSRKVRAPDCRGVGYKLVGGRLLADAGRPAAQFMYQDAHGERMTLYVRADRPAPPDAAMRQQRNGKLGVVYWTDRGLAYALVGESPQHELMEVADAMFRSLNP